MVIAERGPLPETDRPLWGGSGQWLPHGVVCYQPVTTTRPHSPPTPLHRQIKVLHEALARIFLNGYAERLTEGQTAFLPIHLTHLMGVQ